jgi:hypothetical protein
VVCQIFAFLNGCVSWAILLELLSQWNERWIWKVLPWKCNSELSSVLLSYVCYCQQRKTSLSYHVRCLVFLSDLNQTLISWHVSIKAPGIKFHKNLSIGSQIVPCGWLGRWTDKSKLMVTFLDIMNTPKKQCNKHISICKQCIPIVSQINIYFITTLSYTTICTVQRLPVSACSSRLSTFKNSE